MPTFPQLLTGASSQFPIRKRHLTRTVRNQTMDGREIKLPDPAAASLEWQLIFRELTDPEIAALLQFYFNVEGPLTAFTFLDPVDNLLPWSNSFDQAAWQKDPLLQIASGASDPLGGTAAWSATNPAGPGLRLQQTLNAPASYYYAFSVWARSGQPGSLTLHRGDQSRAFPVTAQWSRLVLAADSQSTAANVAFGIELAGGTSVDLFGAQAEAQIGASGYKATTSLGGVWPNTRFGASALGLTSVGPGRHGCTVLLRTN